MADNNAPLFEVSGTPASTNIKRLELARRLDTTRDKLCSRR